ncbi:hypothetical protein ACP4OV_019016 [Aristida adscensionis]
MDQDDDYLLSLCVEALAAACQQAGVPTARRRRAAPAPSATPGLLQPPPLHFRCPLCGKAFASYQALGGHKASHRKPPSFLETGGAEPSAANGCGGAGGRHVCTVCRRGFATGQALGGHKRFHYLHGPSVSAALPASAAGSSAGGLFDLNLAPEMAFAGVRRRAEDEEEVQSPLPTKKQRRPSSSA